MTSTILSREEIAARGDAIYDRDIRENVTPQDAGKFVVIDALSGAWEMDSDELAASDRLLLRHPDAQAWLVRVGSRYSRRFGFGLTKANA